MGIPAVSYYPSSSFEEALQRASSVWGIEPEYWDIFGKHHVASAEVRQAILASLGVRSSSKEELDAAVEERLWREWSRLSAPTLVLSQNTRTPEIPLQIPEQSAGETARLEMRWEDGESERWEIPLSARSETAGAELRGRRLLRKTVPLPPLRLGYHQLHASVRTSTGEELESSTHLIVCPDRAYQPPALDSEGRAAGVAVSLYGLRSERNWGCGDVKDLEAVVDWVGQDVQASFVALNPLHAIPNRQPYNTSPYLPNCTFYRNFIYLDVEQVEDFQRSTLARDILQGRAAQCELKALRDAPFVEYERVSSLKLRFLKLAFRSFLKEEYNRDTERAKQFREFIEQEGNLLDLYATYCALDEWIHTRYPDIWNWPFWPEEYRRPDSEATRSFASTHWRSVLLYKYIQWQLDIQLKAAQDYANQAGLSIGLYHDLALATDRMGSDLWAHPSFYVTGCRVGSPPDDFSPKGQDWGFPPPNSPRHYEDGYRLFRDSIRKNCRDGGALRIDHVMRFFRLYWIPDGMDATHGTYVRDSFQDLLHILALESVRQKVLVIGEDLGTVEPWVREELTRFGILSYRLFYFEKEADGSFCPAQKYPRQALVSATTHDLPTLAGFWLARDIEARRNAGLLPDDASYHQQLADRAREKQKMLDVLFRLNLLPAWFPRSAADVPEFTGDLHNAIIGFLVSTPSQLMVLNQEDLTKETEQQNLPGSTAEYPNWRRKMKFTVGELRSAKAALDFTAMFRNWLAATGRINRAVGAGVARAE